MVSSGRELEAAEQAEPAQRAFQSKAFGRELDGIERDVAMVWAPVLGRELASITATDDFVDSGGTPELAAELLARIEEEFGARMPPDQLSRTPTLGGLAATLKAMVRLTFGQLDPPVRLATGEAGRATVFCVAAMGGTVLPWQRTVSYLDPRIPVLAAESVGMDRHGRPLARVEEIADHLITQLRVLVGDGPVVLCGHSFGGRVAYEMARRLTDVGQRVVGVVLLDTIAVRGLDREPLTLRRLPAIVRSRVRTERKGLKARIGLRARRLGLFLPKDPEHRVRWIIQAQRIAWRRHRPGPFGGDMALLTVDSDALRRDQWLGWRPLVAGEIELRAVPGEHRSMLSRESAPSTAAALDGCLLRMTQAAAERSGRA